MNPAITQEHVIVRLLNGQSTKKIWTFGVAWAEWEKIKNHFFEMGWRVARDDSAGYAFIRRGEDEATEEDEGWEDDAVALCRESLGDSPDLSPNDFHGFAEGGTHALRAKPRGRGPSFPVRPRLEGNHDPYYPELHDEKKIHRQIPPS